tara:strand:- start:10 stop:558 length:549 start_codon:yes stop_codon:yes gene_type:complete
MARMSGAVLGNFLKAYEKMGKPVGQVVRGIGQEIAEQGMQQAAKNVLAGKVVGKTAEEIGKAGLATGVTRAINIAGGAAQYGAPALVGAQIAGFFDQQNVGSQPFRGRKSGNAEFDSFLHQQALEQQRLENEMAVIRQKAVLSVPSPYEMAQAEKLITESGEATNQEVMGVARSLYGTGLRA